MDPKVTVCLTSCNRFHLLQRTLDSFFRINSYPIEKFIITEDSGNVEMRDKILSKYGDKIQLIFNESNLGLFKSIDNMYAQVETDYIFHCEDDWEFYGNTAFMQESIDILEDRKDIHQVWLRPINSIASWVEDCVYRTHKGFDFKMMKADHCGNWNGFSLNSSCRRMSDYKLMFPNGMYEFILPGQSIVHSEHNCMLNTKKFNYRAAILLKDACDHIGQGQSTYK